MAVTHLTELMEEPSSLPLPCYLPASESVLHDGCWQQCPISEHHIRAEGLCISGPCYGSTEHPVQPPAPRQTWLSVSSILKSTSRLRICETPYSSSPSLSLISPSRRWRPGSEPLLVINLYSLNSQIFVRKLVAKDQAWWFIPVIPATLEAEIGGS
jgi:hypothetical protein